MTNLHTVILIGPHGAGKTTLGTRLAAALSWRFDQELGDELRRKALEADPSAHAQQPQPDFDRQVLQAELTRDARVFDCGPRVVETWHLGNLAYAQLRSPAVAAEMAPRIEAAIRRAAEQGLLVQPLQISEATLQARQSEPGPPEIARFFLNVAEQAERLAVKLGLTVAPPLWTDELSPEHALVRLRASRSFIQVPIKYSGLSELDGPAGPL